MSDAIIVDFTCAVCGESVGYEELYPPGVPRQPSRGEEHPLRRLDRHWKYIDNGDRMGDGEVTPEEFEFLAEALRERPEDFLALYCRDCRLTYCFDHWKVGYSGDPAMTFGRCPRGHSRLIDAG